MALSTQQREDGGDGFSNEAMNTDVSKEMRVMRDVMRSDIRDMHGFMERLQAKVCTRQKKLNDEVSTLRDLAESVKEIAFQLTVNLAKVKADLGGEVVGIRAKVDTIAMEVDGVGAKFHGLGTKYGELQPEFVAVKVDVGKVEVGKVADGNKVMKSSLHKMDGTIKDIGASVERALNATAAERRGRKKRRLVSTASGSGNEEQI